MNLHRKYKKKQISLQYFELTVRYLSLHLNIR